jgi:hypothetical protein
MIKKAAEKCDVRVVGIQVDKSAVGLIGQAGDIVEAVIGGVDPDQLPENREPNVTLILDVKNNNTFSFTIESLDVDLFLNAKRVAKGRFDREKKVVLEAGKSAEAELPMNVSLAGLLVSAGSTVTSGKIRYKVDGWMMVATEHGHIRIPVDVKGDRLPFLRVGSGTPSDPAGSPDISDLPPGTMMD